MTRFKPNLGKEIGMHVYMEDLAFIMVCLAFLFVVALILCD